MFWLILLAVIVLVILISRSSPKDSSRSNETRAFNQYWIDFIATYRNVAKTPSEKALVAKMLADLLRQGMPPPSETPKAKSEYAQSNEDLGSAEQLASQTGSGDTLPVEDMALVDIMPPQVSKVELDNASLLLYFGAFLFVASAGLFVAFGGASAVLRTIIILLVSLALYASGVWLYRNRPKLAQAGQAFAGIGVVLAPLVGGALYAYVFNQSHGVFAWLITSIFCLVIYAHALYVFRTALMSYVLIFTFLSLFESGIGMFTVPLYYYGWGLATLGIGLGLLQYYRGWLPELRSASTQSASIFLPISLAASLVLVPSQGATQLGVSLLLAAAFYGLEALSAKGTEREADATVAQIGLILGVVAITYGASQSWFAAGVSLLLVNVAQLIFMNLFRLSGTIWGNFGSVLLVSSLAAVFTTIYYHDLLFVAIVVLIFSSLVLWWRQQREDAYGLAALSWLALPYVAGQLVFGPVSAAWQTGLSLISLLLLLGMFIGQGKNMRSLPGWQAVATSTYIIGSLSVLVCALFAQPLVTETAAIIVAVMFLTLRHHEKRDTWADAAGFSLLAPLLNGWDSAGVFLTVTLMALISLVLLSIRFRRETLRWLSTGVWLLVPVALGHASVGGDWYTAIYAWAYILAMVGLIISRAVARGVIYISSKVPMSSYARSASLSYVAGYIVAAGLAFVVSLTTPDSRIHTSVILGILGLTTIILSRYIEKRNDLLVFLPILAQAFVLSVIRPGQDLAATQLFLGISSILAIIFYFSFNKLQQRSGPDIKSLGGPLQVSLVTAFVSPVSIVFGAKPNWVMATGLLLAGLLLQYHVRLGKQSDRELSGAVIVLAVWWLMYFGNIHQLQAYVHVIVAVLALYAYLRYKRGEIVQSDQYLWWMIVVATVPLALQVLSGAGQLYGWWLLIEQVAIMLLGMAIGRKFVTRWGLYIAVAAVLYQLRGLGYAALAFLAIFLIGLAVYRLQKYTDQK
ncbi:MAG: hypothetical protein ABI220_03365 [Candidatus Saccharimonadales bacterium]